MNLKKTYMHYLPGWSDHLSIRIAWLFLFFIGFIALFGPLIANEKPYYCKLEGKTYFPLLSKVSESGLSSTHPAYAPVDWHTTAFESVWRAPIPWSHQSIDLKTGSFVSPFDHQILSNRFRHWLGTDILGRDVMAGMIRGCRVSLLIGLGSMLLAIFVGIPMGSMAAYWGNRGRRITWVQMITGLLLCVLLFILWFAPITTTLKIVLTLVFTGFGLWILNQLQGKSRGEIAIPVDRIVMFWISIIDGFPGIFLVIILVAIVPLKGWVVVMLTIALLKWPFMARYMRAEVFKIRESNYIKAAQLVNIPDYQILRSHIIPFAIGPMMISFIFGVSTAILMESSLSFLGIGLPTEEINWGRLLSQSRNHFDAWWLLVFPGCAIFFTLLSLYSIGNVWQKKTMNRALPSEALE